MKKYRTPEEIANKIIKKSLPILKKANHILIQRNDGRTTYSDGTFAISTPGTADAVLDVMRSVKGYDLEKVDDFNFEPVFEVKKDADEELHEVGLFNTTPDKKTAKNLVKLQSDGGSRVCISEKLYKLIKDEEPTLYTIKGEKAAKSPVYFELADGEIYGVILPVVNPAGDVWKDTETDTQTEEPATAEETETETAEETDDTPEELTEESITEANYRELAFSLYGLGKKHNPEIILLAGIEAGVITCEMFKNYLFRGVVPPFHTFEAWKANGYTVKKGEKNIFSADIWKYTEKKSTITAEEAASLNSIMTDANGEQLYKEGDETTTSRYIVKKSFFFGPSQVEKITVKPFDLPEGVTRTHDGKKEILSGNTKPHKEAIKAAGYSWNKKDSVWYRYTA